MRTLFMLSFLALLSFRAEAGDRFPVKDVRQVCIPSYKGQADVIPELMKAALAKIHADCDDTEGGFFSLGSAKSQRVDDRSCALWEAIQLETQGTCIIP